MDPTPSDSPVSSDVDQEHGPSKGHTPEPGSSDREAAYNPSSADELDSEAQARVARVTASDREVRKAVAEEELSRLTEEEQALAAERNGLGSDAFIEAIKSSRWFNYSREIQAGAHLLRNLDAVLWTLFWLAVWFMVWRMLND